MTPRTVKIAVAVAVLAIAAVVALWPRDDGNTTTLRPRQQVDVTELRAKAGLAPCPGVDGWQPPQPGAADPGATEPGGADPGAADPGGTGEPGITPAPGGGDAPAAEESPIAGITVPCLGGGADVPLADAIAGSTTVLNVWSHTCEPCRDELPALQEYADRPGAARVLGVQVDGSPEAGLAILTALGVRLPSVSDPTGELRAALQAPAVLPLTYVVLPDGVVRLVKPTVFRSADQVDSTVRAVVAG